MAAPSDSHPARVSSISPGFDPAIAPSPSYVCDLGRLEQNLRVIRSVHDRTGAQVLLALKGFALHATFPLCARYLQGATASSPWEARLARETFPGEVHAYAPAYSDRDLPEYLRLVDHLVFNSPGQWRRFRDTTLAAGVSPGLRVNPEYSEVDVELYDPCAKCSRLGTVLAEIGAGDVDGLEGLHFHTMCEQNSDTLERTLAVVEERFGAILSRMRWANFGGGHHISRPDYDVDRLCRTIDRFRERWGLEVYLEPGEAIGLRTGVLVATVLDVVRNGMDIAILDTSATAHMPDVLEMPYRPEVLGAGLPGEKPHTYRLGGLSCLAGDVIGDYSFDAPLSVGQRIVFDDMIHYTMVKTTTFNGVRLPSIALWHPGDSRLEVVREFRYEDYRDRLS